MLPKCYSAPAHAAPLRKQHTRVADIRAKLAPGTVIEVRRGRPERGTSAALPGQEPMPQEIEMRC